MAWENGHKKLTSLDDFNRSDLLKNMSGLLTSFHWDYVILKAPTILNANKEEMNKIIRLRTDAIQPPADTQNTPLFANIRGHQYSQPGMISTAGQLVISFLDRSDCYADRLFTHFGYLMSSPEYKTSLLPINTYKWDFEILRYSPDGEPVKRWLCKDCVMSSLSKDESMTSDTQMLGSTTVVFVVDHAIQQFYSNGKWSGGFLETTDPVHNWILNGMATTNETIVDNTKYYGVDYYNWSEDELKEPLIVGKNTSSSSN